MGIEITRLSEPLGASIMGVDLSKPIEPEVDEILKQAILDHYFIVLPGQHIEPGEHQRFCKTFGEIQPQRSVQEMESQDHIGMMHVSNAREDGILPNGEMWFHSDQPYFDKPVKMTSLQAIELPKVGGNTRFANCYLAYETLDEATRARIDGRMGMNVYDYNERNMHMKTGERDEDAPRHAHPIVRTHPDTGRKSLFINRLMTDYIIDMDPAESDALLDRLFDHMEQDRFIYEHDWQPDDVAIWDNRCLVHGRTDFDPVERRLLRRFCVIGDVPV